MNKVLQIIKRQDARRAFEGDNLPEETSALIGLNVRHVADNDYSVFLQQRGKTIGRGFLSVSDEETGTYHFRGYETALGFLASEVIGVHMGSQTGFVTVNVGEVIFL